MKTNPLIIGVLTLILGFSACQNNALKTETDQSSMDSNGMKMDSTAMNSEMKSEMDKMMKDMHQMEMTGNADYDLISMLKTHHQGAIDMAKVELDSGTEPKLKQIAQNIVDKQSKENQMLDDMLKSTDKSQKDYEPSDKSSGLGKDMDANMMKMMEMGHDTPGSLDQEFASMMIKHHKEGIDMGNIILKYSKMAEFKSMAQKMIEDQTKEITELEASMSQH
ncbi:MAG: DUF305 domain-containing protein [Bacteroidota bacterium]